MTSTACKI